MIKKQIFTFILRWITSCLAMYACINVCATVKAGELPVQSAFWMYVLAGLVFALVNTVVKPLATLFALPVLLVTWGLFTVLINAGMIALTIWILPGIEISFWGSVGGALLISVINFLVNLILPDVK